MRFRGSPFQLSTPRGIAAHWFIRAMRTPLREPWAVFLSFFLPLEIMPPVRCCFWRSDMVSMHAISSSELLKSTQSVCWSCCVGETASSASKWGTVVHVDPFRCCIPSGAEWTGELAQTVAISVHRPAFWNWSLAGTNSD